MATTPTIMDEYHRLRRAGDNCGAQTLLTLALQVSSYRAEAQLWHGIMALEDRNYADAFLWLAQAAEAMPQRPEIAALLGRAALGQDQPELARKLLEAAWRRHPSDPKLRIALWQARAASQPLSDTTTQMRRMLQYMDSGEELRHVLRYLAQQNLSTVGAVQYLPKDGVISGWAINLNNPQEPAELQLHIGDKRVALIPNRPHPPLINTGYPARLAAFRVKLPPQTVPVRITDSHGSDLDGSPLAITAVLAGVPGYPLRKTAPPQDSIESNGAHNTQTDNNVATQPVSLLNRSARRKKGKTTSPSPSRPIVDVLIPVYKGMKETLACVSSVIRYRDANRTPHQIIVLNDASPDRELTQQLNSLAQQGKIHQMVRPANLGFIRNINRGMALHPDRDVVWLNADTLVHDDWLDRLRAAAYSSPTNASATPFSNNGELLSFPVSRIAYAMPNRTELANLDTLAKKQPSQPIPIETGCGFCLYIKRGALNEVGYLDEVELLRGYGEETDWCLRARQLGWQHVCAPNVFVAHKGGVSFGDEKALRVKHNNDLLRKRHPDAEARYRLFTRRDPLAPARQRLQQARLAQLPAWMRAHAAKLPSVRVLHISNGLTKQAEAIAGEEHLLQLVFYKRGASVMVTFTAGMTLPLHKDYYLPADKAALLSDLRTLPLTGVSIDHHAVCPKGLLTLIAQLNLPVSTARAVKNSLHNQAKTSNAGPTEDANAPAGRILIADAQPKLSIAQSWTAIAHAAISGKSIVENSSLIVRDNDQLWQHNMLNIGALTHLPEVRGLKNSETAALINCTAAATLDSDEASTEAALNLAGQAGVPLYSVATPRTRNPELRPIVTLTVTAPWLVPAALSC